MLPARTVADVGCDHARVAAFCAERTDMFEKVIASDISEKCLQKAVRRLGGKSNMSFVCCDGIKFYCDEAVIAGMGGMEIAKIITQAQSLPEVLITCPHRAARCVREACLALGYGIDCDEYVCERGKYYSVIRFRLGGGVRDIDELQAEFGLNIRQKNEILSAWLVRQFETYAVAPKANFERLAKIRAALALQGKDITRQYNI